MASKVGVLVFPSGEINAVEVHNALSACVNIRLVGASSVDRHGAFVFQNYHSGVPPISDLGFIDAFNQLIDQERIDVVIPTHDDVVLFLAENQAKLHAAVLTADVQTARICRDKRETYSLFSEQSFCPDVYEDLEHFPAFLKPRRGQGSAGTFIISDVSSIPANIDLSQFILCEYLPGLELTVDCFTDKNGILKAVLPRSRQRVFGGVSVRTAREPLTAEIMNIAATINQKLHFLGLWYFQIKQDIQGQYKLMEISARCAGTMCLSRGLGVNLPLLSVYAAMGLETEVAANDFSITVDRTLISRYELGMDYRRVYIDLDDTIILRGRVHLPAIQFLYQCQQNHKPVVLLTRHQADHDDNAVDALLQYKIDPALFERIVELPFDAPKAGAICPEGAIFIDNSFTEREAVQKALGIPVFDVSEIEALLDWRR